MGNITLGLEGPLVKLGLTRGHSKPVPELPHTAASAFIFPLQLSKSKGSTQCRKYYTGLTSGSVSSMETSDFCWGQTYGVLWQFYPTQTRGL